MADPKLLSDAADLFNRKHYFECHELLEDEWRHAVGEEKQFLQGLILIAVGMYHAAAENYRGAVNVLEKGLAKLEPFRPERDSLDLEELAAASRRALEIVKRGREGQATDWTEDDTPTMTVRS
jgi:predicted metal-dependent hydrolase